MIDSEILTFEYVLRALRENGSDRIPLEHTKELAKIQDAISMAEILREIGWSERRNNMAIEEISGPIEDLINHCIEDPDGHTMIVAVT